MVLVNFLLINRKLSSAGPYIHILQSNPFRFVPNLVYHKEQNKNRQEDIIDHEVRCAKWIQETRVSLEENEKNVRRESDIRTVWVESSLIGEFRWIFPLCDECASEADVAHSDDRPHDKSSNCIQDEYGFCGLGIACIPPDKVMSAE